MPSSISSSERRRRVPAALLAALALFAATDHGFWSWPRVLDIAARSTPRGDAGDPLVVHATRARAPEGPLLLLLGSSQVREGLDCAAFGASCLNLAIGGGTPLDALAIERPLQGRERTVVLGIFPKVFHLAPKPPLTDAASAALVVRSAGPALTRQDLNDLLFGLLQQLSPTLRFKDAAWALHGALKGDWPGAWQGRSRPAPDRLLAGWRRQPDEYFARRLGVMDPDTRLGRWTPVQEAALEALIALPGRRRPLVVVDFPTHPGYPSTIEPAVHAHYEGVLARLRGRADVTLVERGTLPAVAEGEFLDFTHVGEAGRARLSAHLARALTAH